jgi:hypothetical protein
MKWVGDVYKSDDKSNTTDAAGEETVISEDKAFTSSEQENVNNKHELKVQNHSARIPEGDYKELEDTSGLSLAGQAVTVEPELPRESQAEVRSGEGKDGIKSGIKFERSEGKGMSKNAKLHRNDTNLHKDSSAKHGEFFIKIKKEKKSGSERGLSIASRRKSSKNDFKSDVDYTQDYSGKEQVDIDTPDRIKTLKTQVIKDDGIQGKGEDKDGDVSNAESQKVKNFSEDEQERTDLGADIIVKIIIGVIAGIAGFSFIFTQLGLINK